MKKNPGSGGGDPYKQSKEMEPPDDAFEDDDNELPSSHYKGKK